MVNPNDVNEVRVVGALDETPELRRTRSGTSVCNPTVITERTWTDSSGEEQQSREFHRCVCWAGLGEKVANLPAGIRVEATGRLQTRSWEDDAGRTRYSTEVVCDEFDPVEEPQTKDDEKPSKSEKQLDGARRSGPGDLDEFSDDALMQDDDLPF